MRERVHRADRGSVQQRQTIAARNTSFAGALGQAGADPLDKFVGGLGCVGNGGNPVSRYTGFDEGLMKRFTRQEVFPEPAPASTNSVRSSVSTTMRRLSVVVVTPQAPAHRVPRRRGALDRDAYVPSRFSEGACRSVHLVCMPSIPPSCGDPSPVGGRETRQIQFPQRWCGLPQTLPARLIRSPGSQSVCPVLVNQK